MKRRSLLNQFADMANNNVEEINRSPLKLTLQIKDQNYTIKGVSNTEDNEDSERESLDENNSTMTDSTNDTSLNDVGREAEIADELSNASFTSESQSLNVSKPEFCDELSNSIFHPPDSNNLNVSKPEFCDETSNSAFHPPDSNNLNENDEQDNSEPSSTTSSTPEIVKTVGKERESSETEVTTEAPIVIKKEKENGEVKTETNDSSSLQKSRGASDKEKSPENGGDGSSNKNDDEFWDAATELAPEDAAPQQAKPPAHPVISVRKAEDLMMSRAQMNGSNEECSVCCERFPSPGALEQHRASAGHYSCSLSEDCSSSVFPSSNDLSQHQAMHHQPPVQQLAQQVQRIPATFTSPNYRTPTPPQQRNVYMPTSPMASYYQGGMAAHGAGGSQQIGSGVVMTSTVSSSVPNLPPGIQLSKRPAPQPPEASSPKQQRREEEGRQIRLPDSITLVSRTPPQTPPQQRRSESVTDMLANRGITVVPSGRPASSPSSSPATSSIPRSLMNTSAISITPSSQQQQQPQQQHRASNFAVPAKPVTRLLTVDLTKDSDSPPRRALNRQGRIRGPTGRSICQICDKAFPTPQELTQHMACHRGGGAPNKLAYECRECTAQYPTEAGLQAHKQKYHGAGGPSPDMAIPVVDLKQVGVLSRLAALGIRSVIPLSQLHSGSGGGIFGLPVVAVDSASNPAICNIGGLGASNLLPLGPLKNLSFNNNMR